ncbi:MAG: glycoside hydrolase family 10 protein [Planctomycetota bacterium]|jgi:uncharacterized lipoprotein YddW (UPF0748 family)
MKKFGLGTWLHRIMQFKTAESVDVELDKLADAGFDVLVAAIKNKHGALDYLAEVGNVNDEYPTDVDPLKLLIEGCKKRGMKFHAWFCVFAEGAKSKFRLENPEIEAVIPGRPKDKPVFACATRPEVQDNVFKQYEEVVTKYRPDALHLDYIRTVGHCVCDYCKSEMKKRGVDIEQYDPQADGHPDKGFKQWTEWRISRVAEMVKRVSEMAHGAGLEVSASVFPNYPECLETQGQDWVLWAEKGYVDYFFPMNYTNLHREAIMRTVAHKALLGDKAVLWEGLGKQSHNTNQTTDELIEQVRLVLDVGIPGVVLFEQRQLTDEDYAALKKLRGK